ncbi:MAG: hypothetical protein ACQESJ_09085 [Bacteroidota bacterium]
MKDGEGNVLASDRLVHIMATSRVRDSELNLITNTETDETDHNKREIHIMLPPQDMEGNTSPVPGTGHGFLHLMFEE